jgi:hypothetical protein
MCLSLGCGSAMAELDWKLPVQNTARSLAALHPFVTAFDPVTVTIVA